MPEVISDEMMGSQGSPSSRMSPEGPSDRQSLHASSCQVHALALDARVASQSPRVQHASGRHARSSIPSSRVIGNASERVVDGTGSVIQSRHRLFTTEGGTD